VRQQLGLQVCAIARLTDLLHYLNQNPDPKMVAGHARVQAYRQRYGVAQECTP
jgi:orotate phosphoribosyltransferase